MKRLVRLNVTTLIAMIVVFYIAYYFLVQDNFLHISISSIIAKSHQLKEADHVLVLGLLPIYIALMVFGAGVVGIFLGSILQQCLVRAINKQITAKDTRLGNSPLFLYENSHKSCKH